MGFDLYSLGNHKNENGEYFRNNVWGWRRLAEFVCEKTGVVEEKNKAVNNLEEQISELEQFF